MDEQLEMRFGPASIRPLSVTQLVRMVSDTLEAGIDEFWVAGEVSNSRLAGSGHFYFTLKDDRSSISAVMFRSDYQQLKFQVRDGMALMIRGRANVFEARGALQIIADEIEPRGVGALQIAFEQLKRRLAAEGLFDRERKRSIPFLPRTVGVVTALNGAGLKDIVRVVLDRFPAAHLIVCPARVQGDGAGYEIATAISDLNRDSRAEVIIVGRGGGSLEDLWAFNQEIVARAIFRSTIPIISAVGHEIDYTIADFVADLRAPTPTAAAQMVVPSMAELRERIGVDRAALNAAMARELSSWRETLDDLALRLRHPGLLAARAREELAELLHQLFGAIRDRIESSRRSLREYALRMRPPDAELNAQSVRISDLELRLRTSVLATIVSRRHRLAEMAGRLDSLSPLRVLERGYAVVSKTSDSSVVVDAAEVQLGEELQIRLRKGELRARAIARNT